ncbi:MAG TPA: YbhB/YbcL family Raf kinase inhibitor-like protein [bacterium]|nr:YbhB/YbcL family Raf kinase inhibitor-like protein [bacterium]HPS30403.1 YbhB/YbcL family Raf kinase inhibitor-like protein [bacterium]
MSTPINLNQMLASSFSMADGGRLPEKFTVDGQNISPHIGWQRIPRNTKSIAIVMNDPDSIAGSKIHWGIFNIPSFMIELEEKRPTERIIGNTIRQVVNDFGKIGYYGPLSSAGRHRYVFTVCALDIMLDLPFNPTGANLITAMHGHLLEKALLRTFYGSDSNDVKSKLQIIDD